MMMNEMVLTRTELEQAQAFTGTQLGECLYEQFGVSIPAGRFEQVENAIFGNVQQFIAQYGNKRISVDEALSIVGFSMRRRYFTLCDLHKKEHQ